MAATGLVIKCPRCGKIATTQPEFVVSYFDPDFKCKTRGCLYVGRLSSEDRAVSPRVSIGRKGRSDKGKKRGPRK